MKVIFSTELDLGSIYYIIFNNDYIFNLFLPLISCDESYNVLIIDVSKYLFYKPMNYMIIDCLIYISYHFLT